jgi:hypothetical protein
MKQPSNGMMAVFGFGACSRVIGPQVIELGLDRVEEITIEDGRLLRGAPRL